MKDFRTEAENGKTVFYFKNNVVTEQVFFDNMRTLSLLREKRNQLFKAFDIHKSNVAFGIVEDTNKQAILDWYQSCLDLDELAINNPPIEITRYLG